MAIAPQKKETRTVGKPLKGRAKSITLIVGIIFVVFFCLAPAMWQLLTSFKVNEAITSIPNVYFPSLDQLTWEHYQELFNRRPFTRYIFNSLLVATLSTFLALVTGAPAAYALARFNIPGERILTAIVLIVTLFPYILLFLGLFEVVTALGIGNTYWALIIPYAGRNLPLTILVLRSFFQQLPKELEDSAKMDGYNTVQMLLRIVFPMTIPAMITTGILAFIFAWNEFIFALTFISKDAMKTIPVGTAEIGGTAVFEIPYGPIAAATVVGTLPLVLLVLFFQRRIVQGLTAGAVKG